MAKKLLKKSYKYAFLKRKGFKSVFKNGHWGAILNVRRQSIPARVWG